MTALSNDPISEFLVWYAAGQNRVAPDAMTLATATKSGKPSARVVLYKGIKNGCFFFVTNYDSRKAKELSQNPYASLVFHWAELEKQIRVDGKIKKASPVLSDEYWAQRPRESQLGAWASKQSGVISSRGVLEKKVAELQKKFEGSPIPRPKNWGGYLLDPKTIEFWIGQPNRLHDRLRYSKTAKGWKIERLSP